MAKNGPRLSIAVVGDAIKKRSRLMVAIRNEGSSSVFVDWRNLAAGWGSTVDGKLVGTPIEGHTRSAVGEEGPTCPPDSFVVGIPKGGSLLLPITLIPEIPAELKAPVDIWVSASVSNTLTPCSSWKNAFLEAGIGGTL
jgi:hypothetical protein